MNRELYNALYIEGQLLADQGKLPWCDPEEGFEEHRARWDGYHDAMNNNTKCLDEAEEYLS